MSLQSMSLDNLDIPQDMDYTTVATAVRAALWKISSEHNKVLATEGQVAYDCLVDGQSHQDAANAVIICLQKRKAKVLGNK